MTRSFRMRLALQASLAMGGALMLVSLASVLALRAVLNREIDATVLAMASIQAASLTDAESQDMHFHDWELTPSEAAELRDLVRYAQVWDGDGASLLRSQYMTDDLPLDPGFLDRAAVGELAWTTSRFDGVQIRVLYYPLERLGELHERHVLQVAAPLESRNALLARFGVFLVAFGVAVTGATFAGAWWLAGRAMRPVGEVIDQAEAIGTSSPEMRIRAYAETREYQRLVEVLNTMLARIERVLQSQRRFTADASHELRSPLTAMRGELELALRRERDPSEYRRALESTLEEVIRLSRISEDLLTLSRSDAGALQPRPEPVDVGRIVESVIERMSPDSPDGGVRIECVAHGDPTADLDPLLLGQVVWNLVDNAVRFSPPGGTVRVTLEGDADAVVLRVDDMGPGFPPETLDRVFDRFFRDDPARSRAGTAPGTGLGLAIVKSVVEAHGGSVVASNVPEAGARVSVRFPRRQSPKP